MTDKEQIMINGVDVSGCEYLTYQLEEDGEYYWFCKISPAGGPDECEYNPECFYKRVLKQLACKTQELYLAKNEIHSKTEYIQEQRDIIEQLTQECEELKKYIKEDLAPHAQVLQKENDNLKEKFKKFFGIDNQECWDIAFLKDENARYREVLEEIEKVINNIFNGCLGRNTVSCRPAHNVCGDLIKILDIINKAKGEE